MIRLPLFLCITDGVAVVVDGHLLLVRGNLVIRSLLR